MINVHASQSQMFAVCQAPLPVLGADIFFRADLGYLLPALPGPGHSPTPPVSSGDEWEGKQVIGSQDRIRPKWNKIGFNANLLKIIPSVLEHFLPLSISSKLGGIRLFSTSVSQFLPCKPVHLYYFSSFHIYALIYDICYPLSDLLHSVWQSLDSSTSLQMTQFRFFLWLSNIPLYICATSSLSTKGGKRRGGGVGGGMNWEIGIDIYTLICIKWITNKNLLYKKINKIKKERNLER